MLITKAGPGQRRLSQMQRTREILSPEGDIAHLSEDERRRLLQEETIVVEFEPDRAKRSLPRLLRTSAERRHALALLDRIETHGDLDDKQRKLVGELRGLLIVSTPRNGARAPAALPPRQRASRARVPSREDLRRVPSMRLRFLDRHA